MKTVFLGLIPYSLAISEVAQDCQHYLYEFGIYDEKSWYYSNNKNIFGILNVFYLLTIIFKVTNVIYLSESCHYLPQIAGRYVVERLFFSYGPISLHARSTVSYPIVALKVRNSLTYSLTNTCVLKKGENLIKEILFPPLFKYIGSRFILIRAVNWTKHRNTLAATSLTLHSLWKELLKTPNISGFKFGSLPVANYR